MLECSTERCGGRKLNKDIVAVVASADSGYYVYVWDTHGGRPAERTRIAIIPRDKPQKTAEEIANMLTTAYDTFHPVRIECIKREPGWNPNTYCNEADVIPILERRGVITSL